MLLRCIDFYYLYKIIYYITIFFFINYRYVFIYFYNPSGFSRIVDGYPGGTSVEINYEEIT